MIEYIIDNAYFLVGNKCYRQVIGIPMGTDPAPFIANLYLHHYEAKWIEDLAKRDLHAAKKYRRTRRFIDDLATLNNKNHIKDNWKNIYPNELILNKENDEDSHGTFLDLDIKIQNKNIVTKIYDKRDNFKFNIVSYPDISGNIFAGQAYGVISGQLIRLARNTSELKDFLSRTKELLNKLCKKGYNDARLMKKVKKTFTRHIFIANKYTTTNEILMESLRTL